MQTVPPTLTLRQHQTLITLFDKEGDRLCSLRTLRLRNGATEGAEIASTALDELYQLKAIILALPHEHSHWPRAEVADPSWLEELA